jgi:hypothetical protein
VLFPLGNCLPLRVYALACLQELLRAVDASEESFLSVIRASLSRGLTLDRAFAHFDVLGVGAVTPDQFMEGLRVRGGRLVGCCPVSFY